MKRDPSLDALLDLDGQLLVIDPEARYWVRFVVRQVTPTQARPHGLNYSLTLHGPDGERLVGFDNAHQVRVRSGPGGNASPAADHKHRFASVRPYQYKDAETLLVDFWTAVEAAIRERRILS